MSDFPYFSTGKCAIHSLFTWRGSFSLAMRAPRSQILWVPLPEPPNERYCRPSHKENNVHQE
jgi:hypothetical protein